MVTVQCSISLNALVSDGNFSNSAHVNNAVYAACEQSI